MSLLQSKAVHFYATRDDTADKFCILGAGSSGLAVAKNFQQAGIPYDCLEREDDVGGNWYFGKPHSSVYRSTRLISSKALTEFTDFPMPDHFPEHPDREMVWRYLRSYAKRFDLYPQIEFNTSLDRLERAGDKGWIVTLAGGERRLYRGVVIASGHNWDPHWPRYSGRFNGDVVHSSEYKEPSVLAGCRVLVVGGGNSGYDIAVESSQHSRATYHSLRRHYHLLPRYHCGQPVDSCGEWMLAWRMPLWLRRKSAERVRSLSWGAKLADRRKVADHQLFQTHPAINSRWPHDVSRGAITPKPDIREFQGSTVLFADGSQAEFDVIVFATGFRISFPFVSVEDLNWHEGRPELFLNLFHPIRDDLFVVGLIQPDSGQFGLVDYQAQLVAAYLRGLDTKQSEAIHLQRDKRQACDWEPGDIRYVNSPRHLLEVEHFGYRRILTRWIRRLQPN